MTWNGTEISFATLEWGIPMFVQFIFVHFIVTPYIFLVVLWTWLQLGAGAGMVGVCLARLAAAKIVLTDGDLATLANLRHNLQVNGVKVHGKETLNCNQPSLCSPANGVCNLAFISTKLYHSCLL
jgi:hypothetical protein